MQKYKTIEAFLNDLTDDKRQQVETLRELILTTEPKLEEHIKWNAPSYVLDGEDRITFNLMNKQQVVKLVFHMGATKVEDKKAAPIMDDESGLIEWNSNIRGAITFASIEEITSNRAAVRKTIEHWLALPAK